MSEFRTLNSDRPFFITLTVVGWIDVFTSSEYCDEVIKNLEFCQKNKDLKVYAYCIMSNHIHLIVANDGGRLSDILRDFKSYTAKKILEMVQNNPVESRRDWMMHLFKFYAKSTPQNKEHQFWQKTNYPTELITAEMFDQKVGYIHQNPVKALYVTEAYSYVYSSANPDSPLKIDVS